MFDEDRYARQRRLPEVGDAGQQRIFDAVLEVRGTDGALIEAEYLMRPSAHTDFGHASQRVEGELIETDHGQGRQFESVDDHATRAVRQRRRGQKHGGVDALLDLAATVGTTETSMPFSASRERALLTSSSCAYGPIRTRYTVWPFSAS